MSVVLRQAVDLSAYVGKKLGTSDWVLMDQSKIDAFAELTGDDHWIHVDVQRAASEMPQGKTIAHGLLILSLIPCLQRGIFTIEQRGKGLNYGYNRVRFTDPVPVGSRVRLHQAVKDCVRLENATRIGFDCSMEVEGRERPALVAESIVQIFDK